MRIYPMFILVLIVFVAAAAPVMANNNITILEPFVSTGSYGTGDGQIDTPISVKVDANDNIYILQQVHTNGARYKSVITIYDKNLTFLRSFDVVKTSMVDTGWDRAWSSFYYDDLASAFYIDSEGTIYILCGWDVVVMDKYGIYKYQFPVSSFMGWIDASGGETKFYYPRGLVITDDGYVVTTSGSSPNKHEIIFIYPDGKLFTKLETSVKDIYDIARDRNGSLYVMEAGSNVVRVYDPTMTKEMDMSLYFNGAYNGNPTSLAFFSNGNFSASTNGIFIYNSDGSVRAHFMDNKLSDNNKNWGRPITTNSEDWLIVVSSRKDADKTPKPVMLYKYETGQIFGAEGRFDSFWNVVGLAVLAMLALVWVIGAWYIIKK